jgi:hypothetical protein
MKKILDHNKKIVIYIFCFYFNKWNVSKVEENVDVGKVIHLPQIKELTVKVRAEEKDEYIKVICM